jgi:hypothetical protein
MSSGTKLRSPFIEGKDAREQARIFAVAKEVGTIVGPWASQYSMLRTIRVQPLSLMLSASGASALSSPALALTAFQTLWIFAIDDLIDEQWVTSDELEKKLELYKKIAIFQKPDTDNDDLAVVLQDVIDRLSSYPLFESLRRHWSAALIGTIDGMLKEHHWRGEYQRNATLPSYRNYIEAGAYSIGGPPHFLASLVTIGDISCIDQYQSLLDLAISASVAIRLSNDLRSHAKEIEEGNINSVLIEQMDSKTTVDEACTSIKKKIHAEIDHCRGLAAKQRTVSGAFERLVVDTALFSCEFYDSHDFHHNILISEDR